MVTTKQLFILFYTAMCCVSCELDQQLNVRNVGDSPGYFIECYCQPDEMFNLTATRIAPIDEDQYLDYSLEFDIYVTTDERFKLYQSLFHQPGTKFIYNYASNRRLHTNLTDTVWLDATAPDGTNITAKTAIPDDIKIDTVILSEKKLEIRFTTSPEQAQNYYILRTDFMPGNEMQYRDIIYRDYYTGRQVVAHILELPDIAPSDSIVIDLKRFTAEGYKYQLSLKNASDANQDNITSPTPLLGNISGALGIFTCYTHDRKIIKFR